MMYWISFDSFGNPSTLHFLTLLLTRDPQRLAFHVRVSAHVPKLENFQKGCNSHILLPFATHCRYHDLGPRPTSQNAAAFSIPTPAPMSWTKRISPKRVTHHDSSWSIIFLKPLINVLGFPPKIFLMGGKQFEYFECSWLVLLTSVLDVIESCFKNGSLLMHARILAPFSLVVILVHLSSFVTRIFPPLAGHREQAWGYLWEAEVRQRRLQNLLVNHLQEPGASGWEPWIYTGRKGSICSILLEFNLQ